MGTIRPEDVKLIAAQGIELGAFAEAVLAIRSGNTYVNVHTVKFPNGEIRGQIRSRFQRDLDDDDDDDDDKIRIRTRIRIKIRTNERCCC